MEAGGAEGYEFQRLHGMAMCSTTRWLADVPGAACQGLCAGRQPSRFARLSRPRLLENGANSSFVAAAADQTVPIESILKRPQAGSAMPACPPSAYPAARDLYSRRGSTRSGVEFGDRVALNVLLDEVKRRAPEQSPRVPPLDPGAAMAAAASGFPAWKCDPVRPPRRHSRARCRVTGGGPRRVDLH